MVYLDLTKGNQLTKLKLELNENLQPLTGDEKVGCVFEIEDGRVYCYTFRNEQTFLNDQNRLMTEELDKGIKIMSSPHFFGSVVTQALRNKVSFDHVLEFLSPIIDNKGFQIEFSKYFSREDNENAANYISEEFNADKPDSETVTTLAKIYFACFPVFARFAKKTNHSFIDDGFYGFVNPTTYESYHSARNYREFITEVFGTYRKDLANYAESGNNMIFKLMSELTDILSVESMVKIMKHYYENDCNLIVMEIDVETIDFVPMLKLQVLAREALIIEFISQKNDEIPAYFMDDTMDMLDLTTAKGLHDIRGKHTWAEVHDIAMRNCETVSENGSSIDFPKELHSLEELKLLGYDFTPLVTPSDFIQLGNELDICIGRAGYYRRARRDSSYCMSLSKDNTNVAAIEITRNQGGWKISQLYAKMNTIMKDNREIREAVFDTINPVKGELAYV